MTSKPLRAMRSASLDLFSRPSKLSQHQVHQLSDIVEASLSSRYSSLRHGRSLQALKDGTHEEENRELTSRTSAMPPTDSGGSSSHLVTPLEETNRINSHTRWASRAMSTVSLPLCEIPERRSSINNFNHSGSGSLQTSQHEFHNPPNDCKAPAATVPRSGKADSPVRHALAKGAQSSDRLRRSPSRTFIRTSPTLDILDRGMIQHPRFNLSTRLPSPLFMGGGTIEGQIELSCDQNAKRAKGQPLFMSKLSVDVLGVEELSDGKRHIFLALAVELFDAQHPPPAVMVVSQAPVKGSELLWELKPSSATVPFCVNLPLNLGPPPYVSKHASIKYLLCPSASIKVGCKRATIRQTWQCQMMTIHDPEKALGSLPSPLIASDTLTIAQTPGQSIKLTAGLHRQTWINGSVLFADLHIVNNSTRQIKRIDLQLEKNTLIYAHAAASTAEKSARHLRLPKRNEVEIVSTTVIKKSHNWKGILAQSSDLRTCELDIPRGHVTIASGRYFEVRYFLRVLVSLNMFRSLAVQLPITIIHLNSLDILPNSLAQVAASVEAKRVRTLPTSYDGPPPIQYFQGQAFEAARRQSLDQCREHGHGLTSSISKLSSLLGDKPPNVHAKHAMIRDNSVDNDNFQRSASASHHHHKRHPSCYHCHVAACEIERPRSAVYSGPKLPRLQVSTSGLGFSESEFEIPPDSPRKVMLSEDERKMIRQQRELKMQRHWSVKSEGRDAAKFNKVNTNARSGTLGYCNVAASLGPVIPHEIGQRLSISKVPNSKRDTSGGCKQGTAQITPNRKRSKTISDAVRPVRISNDAKLDRAALYRLRREVKSMDRGRKAHRVPDTTDDGDVFYDAHPTSRPNQSAQLFALHGSRAA